MSADCKQESLDGITWSAYMQYALCDPAAAAVVMLDFKGYMGKVNPSATPSQWFHYENWDVIQVWIVNNE